MKKNYVQIDPRDNVIVAITNLEKGLYAKIGKHKVVLKEDIKQKHKFALNDFEVDDEIFMYGLLIGKAIQPIKAGSAITTFNVKHSSAEYTEKNKNYNFQDLGFRQQFEIYKYLKDRLGLIPIVIDSDDLQNDPIRILRKLCDDLEIPYCESMLRWKPGPKAYDGIWGVHWYKEINKTSGFIKRTNTYSYKKDMENFSKKDKNIIDKANRYYLQIIEKKI